MPEREFWTKRNYGNATLKVHQADNHNWDPKAQGRAEQYVRITKQRSTANMIHVHLPFTLYVLRLNAGHLHVQGESIKKDYFKSMHLRLSTGS